MTSDLLRGNLAVGDHDFSEPSSQLMMVLPSEPASKVRQACSAWAMGNRAGINGAMPQRRR